MRSVDESGGGGLVRRSKTAVVRRSVTLGCALLGLASACSKLADDCARTLSCPGSDVGDAAVLPNTPATTDAGADAGEIAPSDGGSAIRDASSDAGVPIPTLLDTPCSSAG